MDLAIAAQCSLFTLGPLVGVTNAQQKRMPVTCSLLLGASFWYNFLAHKLYFSVYHPYNSPVN